MTHFNVAPDPLQKLQTLGEGAQFEMVSNSAGRAKPSADFGHALCAAQDPGNRAKRGAQRLLRVLQTNQCDKGCVHCPLRAGNDSVERATFAPAELARLFMDFSSRNLVDGLYLSSGNDSRPDNSMQQMLDTATILRQRYSYAGYLHLKVLPGASFGAVEMAAKLADRVSINLEAPTPEQLGNLTTESDAPAYFTGILERMAWIDQLKQEEGNLRAGQSTQLVIGAGNETDQQVLDTAHQLRQHYGMNRVYYGAFTPVSHTPLENQRGASPRRTLRLYQSDWLLNDYGFGVAELPFNDTGMLPNGVDPKIAIAFSQPQRFPVEINQAELFELLRVPGIGTVSASRIIALRKVSRFRTLQTLQKIGVVINRARHFITIEGKYFGAPPDMVFKAGELSRLPLPAEEVLPTFRQLSLPFEWERETILPTRLTTRATDLEFD